MKKIILFFRRILELYVRFGLNGIMIYWKLKFSSNPIISFTYKNEFQYPIFLRKVSSDFPTFFEVTVRNDYNIPVDFVPKVIVDCGANIGLTSIFFKNKYPDAMLIAIEAEKENFEMVQKNIGQYTNTKALHKGIWNKTAFLKVNNIGLGNWGFTVTETNNATEADIQAISIKDLMLENGLEQIDILKIDIEGSEKELFESDYDYWLSRTKILIIELHDRLKPETSKTVFKALLNYQFSVIIKGQNLVFYMH